MNIFRYEETQETVTNVEGPVIFLAGPTVRGNQQHLQPSWRFAAIEIAKKLGFRGTLVVPEFADPKESDKDRPELPLWEYNGLKRADCVIVWIPRTKELIGLTTNFEHGYWIGRNVSKILYGRPDDSYRNRYTDIMWAEIHKELDAKCVIYSDLEDIMEASIELSEYKYRQREIKIGYTGEPESQTARW